MRLPALKSSTASNLSSGSRVLGLSRLSASSRALGLSSPSFLAAGGIFPQVLPWLGVLLVVVIVGAAVLMALRRTLTRRDGGGAGGYTLQDLRQMHATGELSDEEFERARQSIIERVKSPRSENRGDENQAEESPGKSPRAGT